MKSDRLFARLMRGTPETYLQLANLPADRNYSFKSEELKESALRLDGIFIPELASDPVLFVEPQLYKARDFYPKTFAKVFLYLGRNNPDQPFHVLILFGSRSHEPENENIYEPFLNSASITRVYLDQLPDVAESPFGLALLKLLMTSESEVPESARILANRAKTEIQDSKARSEIIDLLETVVICKLVHLSREEIQAMLQTEDIRETRFFKEVFGEGKLEGREEGRGEMARKAISAFLKQGLAIDQIAEALDLSKESVQKIIQSLNK